MGPHLQQAKKDIAGAIAAEQLTVWGALSDVSPQQQVPAERFRRHDVVVDEFGEMVPRFPHKPYHGPRWKHIEFDLEQVQRLWPKPPPPSSSAWMLTETRTLNSQGRIGKRDDLVKRCMAETGCTKRAAELAHKQLPDELRRPKGRAPRTRG